MRLEGDNAVGLGTDAAGGQSLLWIGPGFGLGIEPGGRESESGVEVRPAYDSAAFDPNLTAAVAEMLAHLAWAAARTGLRVLLEPFDVLVVTVHLDEFWRVDAAARDRLLAALPHTAQFRWNVVAGGARPRATATLG